MTLTNGIAERILGEIQDLNGNVEKLGESVTKIDRETVSIRANLEAMNGKLNRTFDAVFRENGLHVKVAKLVQWREDQKGGTCPLAKKEKSGSDDSQKDEVTFKWLTEKLWLPILLLIASSVGGIVVTLLNHFILETP